MRHQKKPLDAERTLLGARRYGNFPTLEYEIASARLMAGFYRDAAEELDKEVFALWTESRTKRFIPASVFSSIFPAILYEFTV